MNPVASSPPYLLISIGISLMSILFAAGVTAITGLLVSKWNVEVAANRLTVENQKLEIAKLHLALEKTTEKLHEADKKIAVLIDRDNRSSANT